MNLHTDIPTRGQIDRLLTNRDPSSVSIYGPTDPASSGDADRIEHKNLAAEAVRQLEEAGTPKADVSGIGRHVDRDAGRVPVRQQSVDLATGRDVGVEVHESAPLVAGERLPDAVAGA